MNGLAQMILIAASAIVVYELLTVIVAYFLRDRIKQALNLFLGVSSLNRNLTALSDDYEDMKEYMRSGFNSITDDVDKLNSKREANMKYLKGRISDLKKVLVNASENPKTKTPKVKGATIKRLGSKTNNKKR